MMPEEFAAAEGSPSPPDEEPAESETPETVEAVEPITEPLIATSTHEPPTSVEAIEEEAAEETVVEDEASEADEATDEPESVEEVVAAEPEPVPVPNNKRWYVVKVQNGREDTIKEAIERRVKIENLEEYYGQIYIPTEKFTELKNVKKDGKTQQQRVTRERKTLPGYFMAEVEYNDRILYLFRETSGVGDFVGGTINRPPPPMTQREIDHWMGQKEGAKEVEEKVQFEKGDKVLVKDGMFKDMEGEVQEVLEAKKMVKVGLTIFGRLVPVDLEYWQAERL